MQGDSQGDMKCAMSVVVQLQDGVVPKLLKWQQDDGLLQKTLFDVYIPSSQGSMFISL